MLHTNKNYMGAAVLSALRAQHDMAREQAGFAILLLGDVEAQAHPLAAIHAQHGIRARPPIRERVARFEREVAM